MRKIDIPVQLGRIALLVLMWWLWWSDTIWDGWDSLSIFGVQPFPNVPPTFRAAPGETWDYLTEILGERLFWVDFWVTVKEALAGFVIASFLGVTVALLLVASSGSRRSSARSSSCSTPCPRSRSCR